MPALQNKVMDLISDKYGSMVPIPAYAVAHAYENTVQDSALRDAICMMCVSSYSGCEFSSEDSSSWPQEFLQDYAADVTYNLRQSLGLVSLISDFPASYYVDLATGKRIQKEPEKEQELKKEQGPWGASAWGEGVSW